MLRKVLAIGSAFLVFGIALWAGANPEKAYSAISKYGLPGIYNASPITLTDGSGAALAVDSNGRLILSSSSQITISGGVDGHWYPAINNAYNLGTTTSSWRDAYVSGTLYVGSLSVTNGFSATTTFTTTTMASSTITTANIGTLTVNGTASVTGNLTVGGTLSIGGDGYTARTALKAFTIFYGTPTSTSISEGSVMFPRAATIRTCRAIIDCPNGCETENVGHTLNLRHGTNRSVSSTAQTLWSADVNVNSTTTEKVLSTTYADATLAAGEMAWLDWSATSNTPANLTMKCEYSED